MWIKIRFYLLLALFLLGAVTLLGYDSLTDKQVHRAKAAPSKTFQEQVHVEPASRAITARQEGKPVRIVIPSLSIDLSVQDGRYNDQDKTWSLSNDKAQYALITPLANNESGNTFIYGHNRKQVFARLPDITPGAEAYIYTDNGKTFKYIFRSSYVTNPYDDSLFYYRGFPILTLQTCTGLWYQDRQLFTFAFEDVK